MAESVRILRGCLKSVNLVLHLESPPPTSAPWCFAFRKRTRGHKHYVHDVPLDDSEVGHEQTGANLDHPVQGCKQGAQVEHSQVMHARMKASEKLQKSAEADKWGKRPNKWHHRAEEIQPQLPTRELRLRRKRPCLTKISASGWEWPAKGNNCVTPANLPTVCKREQQSRMIGSGELGSMGGAKCGPIMRVERPCKQVFDPPEDESHQQSIPHVALERHCLTLPVPLQLAQGLYGSLSITGEHLRCDGGPTSNTRNVTTSNSTTV
ncbi:hypothetical protein B0H17DRAFT_1125092 [Mycena rosella]|uniref:Uncharacterized protein n=1 Tax=Mycena rosella TaxID=1033263 RepID=A0AAD7MAZ2_MYCRO|nr:hypothetical protein B0H17DRAFT_1125092 [Mycena rosella]